MKQRIAVLGALLLAMVGIVVIAPESTALNATGTYTVSFNCVQGAHNSTTDFTYSLTLDQVDPATNNNGAKYWYTFQLNSSTFHGTPPPGNPVRSPSLSIGPSGQSPSGEGWISAGFGGSQNTSNHTWPNGTAQDGVTLVDGINVDWTPRTISIRPNFEGNNRLRFSIYGVAGGCVQYLDLGFPDAPIDGGDTMNGSCYATESPDHISGQVWYQITKLPANQYKVEVTDLTTDTTVTTPPGTQPWSRLKLRLTGFYDPDGPTSAEDKSLINDNLNFGAEPYLEFPDTATHVDWLTEVPDTSGSFKPIIFEWSHGPDITPTLELWAEHSNPLVSDCVVATKGLGFNWGPEQIGADPQYEAIVFDDCSSNPTELQVRPIWERTTDGKYFRLKSLSIYQENSSASKIVLDAGTATVFGGVVISELKFPEVHLVTIGSGATLANRTITNGETQIIPVNDPGKWVRISLDASKSTAPNSFYTPANFYPTVTIHGRVYNSFGAECVPDPAPPGGPGGSGNISDLHFQPVVL